MPVTRRVAARPPRRPSIPASLERATPVVHDLEDEVVAEKLEFGGLDLSERDAESVEFAQCRFRGTDLSGTLLPHLRLTDCEVQNSNFANVRVDSGSMHRASFGESRMTGFALTNGKLGDVVFERCRLDLSGWRFTGFDSVVFSDCKLTGADFTNADLRGARFVGCDLTGAQFHHASMAGARFRRCELLDIAGITSWRGAIIHPDDLPALSYSLASGLGITLEDD